MIDNTLSIQRANLLADVAEMYYLENMNQSQIAKKLRVDRSLISRMLTESRKNNIVEILIHRLIPRDRKLEHQLRTELDLDNVVVTKCQSTEKDAILDGIGRAAAVLLQEYINAQTTIGTTWGTSVNATISAMEKCIPPTNGRVVQMVGALDAQRIEYNGTTMVQELAQKIQGEAYFLNSPFYVDSELTAQSLLNNSSISQTLRMLNECNLALVGVGSIDPEYSSFYQASYVELSQIESLIARGVVGDVCGLHFDILGNSSGDDFSKRCVTVSREQLMKIPVRFGVSGGEGKAKPIIGAARGKYINVLVTESNTAKAILQYLKNQS
ncbi:MAG: hypothetical protein K8R40_10850 [Anaerolineaceae bacterium]|nr:hypothetical protein [Anaerolineaceae bacterium]